MGDILKNETLKQRSLHLITNDDNEFIQFLQKIFKTKLNEKIWNKCDPQNDGEIGTKMFMFLWSLPVTLFHVAMHQRKHGNESKPELDPKEIELDYLHLATWIVHKYGQQNKAFILRKESFAENLIKYVTAYADAK